MRRRATAGGPSRCPAIVLRAALCLGLMTPGLACRRAREEPAPRPAVPVASPHPPTGPTTPPPYPERWIEEARDAHRHLSCQELIYKRECAEVRTGTIEMAITVGADGRVANVEAVRNEIRNDPEVVEQCLRQKVLQWKFHAPESYAATFRILLRFSDMC